MSERFEQAKEYAEAAKGFADATAGDKTADTNKVLESFYGIDSFGAGVAVGRMYATDTYARKLAQVTFGAFALGFGVGGVIAALATVVVSRYVG